MKLIHKITVVIIIIAVLVALVFGLVIYTITLSSLQDAVTTSQIELAEQTIDKIARQNAFNMLMVIIPVIIGAAATVLFALQRLFISPVVKLTSITDDIARGDFTRKAEVTSNDEISQLAMSFNQMASKLKDLYSSLEKKVDQRTNELEESNKNLAKKISEAEELNALMIGRELKMIELKEKFGELEKRLPQKA